MITKYIKDKFYVTIRIELVNPIMKNILKELKRAFVQDNNR